MPGRHTFSEDAVVADYLSGMTQGTVSRRHRLRNGFVVRLLRQRGIPIRGAHGRSLAAADKVAVAGAYAAGRSMASIAADYGLTRKPIQQALLCHGLAQQNRRGGRRSHAVNAHAFDSISEEAPAYWVGFLLADGCNRGSCINVGLSARDVAQLEKLRAFLGSDAPIVRVPPRGWSGEMARLSVHSTDLCDRLAELGVVRRKSLIAEARCGLETSRHFWRGVVDGNGWITVGSNGVVGIGLAGAGPLMAQFAAFVVSAVPGWTGTVRPKGRIFETRVSGRRGVDLIRLFYEPCTVVLDRKLLAARAAIG